MTKLQVAIDLLNTEDAIALAKKVAPYIDIIELGTPLIKSEGLRAITAMKEAFPDKKVFADFKTADYITILGSVDDATIAGAVAKAKEYNRGVVVDTIGIADRVKRAQEVIKLGVEFVELHAGLDEQAKEGYSIQVLIDEATRAGVPVSIAGGVNLNSIEGVKKSGAVVAVAGGAIYGAEDPAAAAKALKEALIAA
jgi:3-hexulose-6-phosphate synthase